MKANELRINNLVTIDKLMQESLYETSEVIIKDAFMPIVSTTKGFCNVLTDSFLRQTYL